MEIMNVLVGVALFIFFAGVFTAITTFFVMYLRKKKKYSEFVCVVWEKDGFGQLVQSFDRAGIFVDKHTNNKRLYLKKGNVGLTPDNIPYITAGKSKFIYLFKEGLKNYRYIRPVINSSVYLNVGEEDVNWALNDYEKVKRAFEKKNWLKEVAPYAMFALVVVAFLAIAIFILRRFDVLAEVSQNLSNAAKVLADAQTGTTVIPQ